MLRAAGVKQATGTGGEFTPPTYYVADTAPFLRAGQPFLNALGTKPLPKMTPQLNFPKITTGGSAAVQSPDGATTSNTDLVTAMVTAQVQTSVGRSVVSFQVSDLSSEADPVILADLIYACNTRLDADILAASSATNAKSVLNTAGTNTITYTDGTPTGAEFYSPLTQAAAAIGKNAGLSPSFAVTHPSVLWLILGGLDGNTRPLVEPEGADPNDADTSRLFDPNPMQPGEPQFAATIAGLPFVSDANLPTNLGAGANETRVVVLNRAAFDVYVSPPMLRVGTDSASLVTLQNQLVCSVYWCIVPRQPKAASILAGTGLIPQPGY
jgi:hypothetical protein